MITLPQVTVVGTLTADPELRFTPAGKAVSNFTIASNSRKKNQQTGEWEDGDATFLRGSIWGPYAENVAESLKKGLKVIAVGTLKQRSYEKDGQNRIVFELEAEEVGPSLRFATASVARAGQAAAPEAAPASDPWGSWNGGGEEPPF